MSTSSINWKNLNSERLFINIAETTAKLHSFTNSDDLLQHSLDALLQITEATAGSIFIWDDSAKELILRVARGPYLERVSGARIKLKEGVSGWVAEQGHSVLVKNILEDDRFQEIKRMGKYSSLSFISQPILLGHKLVGVINLTEKKDLAPFNEDDFDRVGAMSNHIAIAYENIKTERRLWAENEELSESVLSLRDQLKQQESLVSIGKLSSNLAHELNNPLDGIRRFINLALDHMTEDSLSREYLLKAKNGVRRSIQVIRGMLAFSLEASRQVRKTSDVHDVLKECIVTAKHNPCFSDIDFEYAPFEDITVHVRDAGLVTVVQNLFENARHAMEHNGKIKVVTEKSDKHVIVFISDNGSGVPEELKNRIFEPFFTTKEKGKGTGIGLSICRDIIERSGGEMTFESEAGQGTTFKLRIPFVNILD